MHYTTEEYNALTEICNSVLILPRQAETSTSDKLRKKLMANMSDKVTNFEAKFNAAVEETRNRLSSDEIKGEPFDGMMEHLSDSTDWVSPVVAAAKVKGKWYYGTNQCDHTLSKKDLNERTELFYSTVEHAEINLLKRIGDIGETDTVYVSLFPCDRCMKTLIDKGIKKIYYMEDHLDRNWSKRSHLLAEKKGIELIDLSSTFEIKEDVSSIEESVEEDYSSYKYIYPPNSRKQEQLDIMTNFEKNDKDPLDPDLIEQDILFFTKYWYISENRFPYENVERQFLIASRYPVYNIEDMSEEMWDDLNKVWLKLISEYGLDGGALCFRFGDPSLSGASLKRLHAHLIMPKVEEKAKFTVGGHKTLKKGLEIK